MTKHAWMGAGIVALMGAVIIGYALRELIDASPTSPEGSDGALVSWVVMMILVVAALASFGKASKDTFAGVLIDRRNRYSTSRLQVAAWSTIVLTGFAAAALSNLEAGGFDQALEISVSEEVWALLGISTASFTGASLVKKQKQESGVQAPRADAPSLSDLVQGEELGNRDYVDLGKVQMLFFTSLLKPMVNALSC